ncbi:MAG: hypothetical protein M0Q26_05970 [Chitinophagaceae bacterium]|nr:hypothetical protein [Chitinophagaceae bacterium]MDP1763430.1 hypothetical protein [Sediminibacterium sp.]
MNTGRYQNYKRADVSLQETGYLKAWLNLKTDFTTLQEPVLTPVTPLIGEQYTIATAHVWAVGKEAMSIYVKQDTIEAPGETQGESGSLRILWTPKIFFVGDGAITLELINNFLNEELILFVQDQCIGKKFIQFGCGCAPAKAQKGSFTSGQLKSGAKGYELTLETISKYFYTAAISERA